MKFISIEFCLTIILILVIFTINICQILDLILNKNPKRNHFIRSILFNYSFSSLIIALWLIPFFYFRSIWSTESILWRLWSFLFHITDAVQLYSFLLLITNSNPINLSYQRFFLCLIWLAPIFTYSPILWLSSTYDTIDFLPYRRLTIHIPWWILPIIYSTMYFVPIIISFILIALTICWPRISKQRKPTVENEHKENMAELTSLIETVLNFELDQSTTSSTINTDHTSLSYISTKFNRSSFFYENFSLFNDNIEQQAIQIDSRLLLLITCLLFVVHLPYVLFSLMDIYISQLPIFIYIHWFGTLFIPIIHLQRS